MTRSNADWFEMAVHMASKGLSLHLTALNKHGSCDFFSRIREVFDFAHRCEGRAVHGLHAVVVLEHAGRPPELVQTHSRPWDVPQTL